MALTFSNLDKDTQDSILTTDVIFQGHKSTLNLLIKSNNVHDYGSIFTSESLHMLQSSTDILEVGLNVPDFIQFCVPHRLSTRTYVRPQIFKARTSSDIFVFTNATVDELQSLITNATFNEFSPPPLNVKIDHVQNFDRDCSRFVIMDIDNAEKWYSELCKTVPCLHWLHLFNQKLKWKRSQNNVNLIRQYTMMLETEVNLEYVLDIRDKMILICKDSNEDLRDPLPYLAHKAKEGDPFVWVIQLKLDSNSDLIDKVSSLSPEEVLAMAAKLESPLEQDLFQIYLKYSGNIIVLVDLCYCFVPNYAEKCRSLLLGLSKLKVKKIITTCQWLSKTLLEDMLSTLSFSVVHFTEVDQIKFLCNLWKSSPMSGSHLETFAKKAVNLVMSTCLPTPLSVYKGISIPLITIIVAEVFHGSVMHPSVGDEFATKLNVANIFETFVDNKFKNYFTKFPTALNEHDSKQLYLRNHMHIALSSSVCTAHVQKLLKSNFDDVDLHAKIYLTDVVNTPEKSGIITEVFNDIPHFTHSFFATYFTALFFALNYRSGTEFILDYFYTDHMKMVRFMFDSILAKDRELHTAIIKNDAVTAEALLKSREVDVNSTDSGGRTALHLAASLRFSYYDPVRHCFNIYEESVGPRPRSLVELLLGYGANVNVQDGMCKFSPLSYALKTQSWDAVEFLLAGGANGKDLRIPQHLFNDVAKFAIANGYVNLLMLLFDSGLPVDFLIDRSLTLLYKACCHGHSEIVNLLLTRGADKRAMSVGENPLHIAVLHGHVTIVQSLLQSRKPAKVTHFYSAFKLLRRYAEITTANGLSPVLLASTGNSPEIVRLLVQHGADISAIDGCNQTCLHRACHYGNYNMVRTVIEMFVYMKDASVLINKLNKQGESAVHIAVRSNRVDIVKLLVSNGGDIYSNFLGKSVLHWASLCGFTDVVNFVKDDFSNMLDILDDRGRSALHLATWNTHTAVVELLSQLGGDIWLPDSRGRTCVHLAAWKGNLNILQILLNNSRDKKSIVANINIIDGDGKTAAHLASYWGYTEVIRFLIFHGADVHLANEDGRSCLHLTSWRGTLSAIQEVIDNLTTDKVSAVNARDKTGKSPMHLASYWGHSDVVRLLITNGADVWTVDDDGNTCLHRAAMQCELNAAQAIVDSLGGKKEDVFRYVNIVNKDGLTASDLAVLRKSKDVSCPLLTWIENILKESSPVIVTVMS